MKRAWVFVGILALSACGIQPTGSVDAGPGARATWEATTVYYLVDGQPYPAARPGAAAIEDIEAALAAGPTEQERAAGMGTEVPSSLQLTVDDGRLVVDAPDTLSDTALSQIACTVQRTRPADTTLYAPDGAVIHDAGCSAS